MQVWAICFEFFDNHAPTPAIGGGMGPAEAVFAVGLNLDADGIPYPEHANIVGWYDPGGVLDSEIKHFWMDRAQKIAPQFSFVARPID